MNSIEKIIALSLTPLKPEEILVNMTRYPSRARKETLLALSCQVGANIINCKHIMFFRTLLDASIKKKSMIFST